MNLNTSKGREHLASLERRRKARIEKRFANTVKTKKDAKTSK